jgi:hypothetical protein
VAPLHCLDRRDDLGAPEPERGGPTQCCPGDGKSFHAGKSRLESVQIGSRFPLLRHIFSKLHLYGAKSSNLLSESMNKQQKRLFTANVSEDSKMAAVLYPAKYGT